MTTIVWDGRYLAADSLASRAPVEGMECEQCGHSGGAVRRNAEKIFLANDKHNARWDGHKVLAVTFAGSTTYGLVIKDYILEHGDKLLSTMAEMKKLFGKIRGFEIMNMFFILTEKNIFILEGKEDILKVTKKPLSTKLTGGSGRSLADGHMGLYDVNAYQAIQLTSITSQGTGGHINVFDKLAYDEGKGSKIIKKPAITKEEAKAFIRHRLGGTKPKYKYTKEKGAVFIK